MRPQRAIFRRTSLLFLSMLLFGSISHAQEVSIRPVIGGFPADAGFALGGAISRTHSPGPIDIRAKGIVSVKKYEHYEAGFDLLSVTSWLSFHVTGRYRNFPEEDYWGLGPN